MATLKLIIGVSGSGKSTFAQHVLRRGSPAVYLSSDGLRGVIGSSESDQSVNHIVFKTLFSVVEFLLKSGQSVMVDATSVDKRSRAEFITIARKHGAFIEAYCVDTPISIAKQRNAGRNRIVPDEAIDRQASKLIWPDMTEVDEVFWVYDTDAVRERRV